MRGKWIFVAIATLLSVLLALQLRLLVICVAGLFLIRLLIEKDQKLLLICIVSTLFAFFTSKQVHSENQTTEVTSVDQAVVHVTFKQFPQIDGDRLQAIVTTTQKEKLLLTYSIQSEREKHALLRHVRSGTSCQLKGELTAPPPNRNEHAFNYEDYLFKQKIHLLFIPNQWSFQTCTVPSFSVISTLQNIRASGIQIIEDRFPTKLIPYAEALIFGERESFSPNTMTAYQKLGIVHLLAISGLHIGMIAGALYFLLLRIGLSRELTFWLLIIFLPAYGVLSGGNPPVVRAILMTIFLLFSKRWRLPLTTLDALSLSFIVFLLFDPYLMYHAGFQLSFAVSFAIVITSGRLIDSSDSYVKQMLKVSLSSFLASLPILSYHFYEFSIISIFANIIYVPFYTFVVLPFIFVLFFLSFFSEQLFLMIAYSLSQIIEQSEMLATWMSSFPFATMLTGKPMTSSTIFIVIGVLAYFILRERHRNVFVSALPLLLVLSLHWVMTAYLVQGEVVFIDIGQGDSTLIQLPYNRGTYLIDTGGQIDFPREEWQERKKSFHVADHRLIPFLKSKGIRRLDKLILTHPDIDHIGAAKKLLDEIKVKEMYITPNSLEEQLMKDIIYKALQKNVTVTKVKAGNQWSNRSGTFSFIAPINEQFTGNNDSLVLYATFGGLTWLFPGDAEKEAEDAMIATYEKLNADVLKVGHHGSRTSTTEPFIQAVKPRYAVISAGRNNRYGHPHQEVVDRLNERRVHIFRTDVHGAIHYKFSHDRGTFRTILPYDVINQ